MKDIRKADCFDFDCDGKIQFDLNLIKFQFKCCNKCGKFYKIRPYKNGKVTVRLLEYKED